MTIINNPFLKEIEALYVGLFRQGMIIGTIDELFLTFEGLLRAMDVSRPPLFKINDEPSRSFEVFCARGFIPLMIRSDGKKENLLIGIITHDASGQLRDFNEASINLEEILDMSLKMNKDNSYLKYVFLTPEQAKELLQHKLIFDKRQRLHYLKGIDADTTAAESFDAILKFAVSENATDIHIEPGPDGLARIRYRLDGLMQTGDYDLTMENIRRLVALVKHRANLKIDEHMLPQDGGISFGEDDIKKNHLLVNCSLRVALTPTIHDPRKYGEKVVLRLLHSKRDEYDLEKLGMKADIKIRVKKRLAESKGLILVTGPTGSGKTTTLYSMLEEINDGTRNITTIEDPVEVALSGITQIPINTRIGMNFPEGLRSILRQDPDVIMVGEIRDKETADIALNATNTGHLVLATVHADDAQSTLLRLQRLGVGSESIAPNLKVVLSQRLVRKACFDCLEEYDARDELTYLLGGKYINSELLLHHVAPGNKLCRQCGGVGYRGRFLLLEYWGLGYDERQMIISGVEDHDAYVEVAMKHGFKPMIYLAIEALLEGITDIPEIIRSAVTEEEFLRHGKEIGAWLNRHLENTSEAKAKK
ncbi:MAG: GspE/PulE family protein [Candidatus Buchananbacteria bacterium]|nr:GspE/PulE family protein [Candidatus Buchananbacteria bacterium]